MAKGLEDSALYVYYPLSSLNEVGGAPDSSGVPAAEFHVFCRNRQKHGHTLNATSTHDTKRAEDVRARINVLSEVPEEWDTALQSWTRRNMAEEDPGRTGKRSPILTRKYLVYQTMLGAWPLDKGRHFRLPKTAPGLHGESGAGGEWSTQIGAAPTSATSRR